MLIKHFRTVSNSLVRKGSNDWELRSFFSVYTDLFLHIPLCSMNISVLVNRLGKSLISLLVVYFNCSRCKK